MIARMVHKLITFNHNPTVDGGRKRVEKDDIPIDTVHKTPYAL